MTRANIARVWDRLKFLSPPTTVHTLAPGFAAGRLDALTSSIVHPSGEYSFISPTMTRVAAESGTDGRFEAATAVPEPASVLLLGAGLLLGVGATRRRAGHDA